MVRVSGGPPWPALRATFTLMREVWTARRDIESSRIADQVRVRARVRGRRRGSGGPPCPALRSTVTLMKKVRIERRHRKRRWIAVQVRDRASVKGRGRRRVRSMAERGRILRGAWWRTIA